MKKILSVLGVSFLALVGCLVFLDPYALSPLEFVPIIGLVYVFSGLAVYSFMAFFTEYALRQRIILAIILGFTPTILCALMTLGTVSAFDVVLAVTVPTIIAWYSIRVRSNQ